MGETILNLRKLVIRSINSFKFLKKEAKTIFHDNKELSKKVNLK